MPSLPYSFSVGRRFYLLGMLVLAVGCHPEPPFQPAPVDPPDSLTLYSIDGSKYRRRHDEKPDSDNWFYSYPVLGKLEVDTPQARSEIIGALEAGKRNFEGISPACFNPRHGLRSVKDGVNTDYVICFECTQFHVWRAGSRMESAETTSQPEAVFNRFLEHAGIPIAP